MLRYQLLLIIIIIIIKICVKSLALGQPAKLKTVLSFTELTTAIVYLDIVQWHTPNAECLCSAASVVVRNRSCHAIVTWPIPLVTCTTCSVVSSSARSPSLSLSLSLSLCQPSNHSMDLHLATSWVMWCSHDGTVQRTVRRTVRCCVRCP